MKVLFCGLGSIGQRHLRNLYLLRGDDVEVLAYRSSKGSTPVLSPNMMINAPHTALEEVYNIQPYDDLNVALAKEPDICFITNPNSEHLSAALAAAKAGCHLFIEKPLADKLEGLEELIQVVNEKNLVIFVAYQFRFHPGLQIIKEKLDEGTLGNLTMSHIVNGEYLPNWHPYEDYRHTHPAKRELGGGCLNIQTHELDYALWLFGLPHSVYAIGDHTSHLEINVEDSVSLLLHYKISGKSFPVHIHLDYLQRPPQRVCDVVGEYGRLYYDYYVDQLEFTDYRSQIVQTYDFKAFDRNQMFIDELSHFLVCVEDHKSPLIDLQQGIMSMLIGQAAKVSLHEDRVVTLKEVQITS